MEQGALSRAPASLPPWLSGKEFAQRPDPAEAIWQAPAPDDDTVIIHVRDVGIVFTDASGIADIVFSRNRTASS
jgi:hypothetical protein